MDVLKAYVRETPLPKTVFESTAHNTFIFSTGNFWWSMITSSIWLLVSKHLKNIGQIGSFLCPLCRQQKGWSYSSRPRSPCRRGPALILRSEARRKRPCSACKAPQIQAAGSIHCPWNLRSWLRGYPPSWRQGRNPCTPGCRRRPMTLRQMPCSSFDKRRFFFATSEICRPRCGTHEEKIWFEQKGLLWAVDFTASGSFY